MQRKKLINIFNLTTEQCFKKFYKFNMKTDAVNLMRKRKKVIPAIYDLVYTIKKEINLLVL